MKKPLAIFFQSISVLIGIGTATFMLWEPHLEGRNINSTVFEIYFNDPFLAYVYAGSLPFFIILYQAYKLFGDLGQNKMSSARSVKALRIIKLCAMTLVGLILAAEAYLFIVMRGKDDIAGGVALGLFMTVISIIIAATAAKFERNLLKNNV